jgi:hypothetical protein
MFQIFFLCITLRLRCGAIKGRLLHGSLPTPYNPPFLVQNTFRLFVCLFVCLFVSTRAADDVATYLRAILPLSFNDGVFHSFSHAGATRSRLIHQTRRFCADLNGCATALHRHRPLVDVMGRRTAL